MRHLRPVLIGLVVLAIAAVSFDWQQGARAETTTVIEVGDLWFCDSSHQIDGIPPDEPCATVVNVGDTVVWEWGSGGSGTSDRHTSTHCADNFTTCSGPREWDSADLFQTSGTFSHTFGPEDTGTFLYLCRVHPTFMRGQITVLAAEQPTPTPSPTPTLSPTPSPTPTLSPTPSPTPNPSPTPTPATTPAVMPAGGSPPAGGPATPAPAWLFLVAGGGLLTSVAMALALRAARPA